MPVYPLSSGNPFETSRDCFEEPVKKVSSTTALALQHDEVERFVEEDGRELLRRLYQAHLDLRAVKEAGRAAPTGADGERRGQRRDRERRLSVIFGTVDVRRQSFGARGSSGGLRPLDVELNLPEEQYSLGVRRQVVDLVVTQSFDASVEKLRARTGTKIAKRQVEELTVQAAVDFDAFYGHRHEAMLDAPVSSADLLVLSTDGKGIVMRREGLRAETRRKADRESGKLVTRLSPGEKGNRKRMAEVAAVYDLQVQLRTIEDVLPRASTSLEEAPPRAKRPRAANKRVWASLKKPLKTVVKQCFEEALARDAWLDRQWVYLVDGNQDQLREGRALGEAYGAKLTIVVDFIHVLEYLWKAAWCFFESGDKGVEAWVLKHSTAVLQGKASSVAGGLKRAATMRKLTTNRRVNVDKCARFLLNQKDYLHYDDYLARGLPIATGVIEGACRHLINDRLGITGARWGLERAEAMLQLRALKSSGDLDEYWAFHRRQELHRNHLSRYAETEFPALRAAA